jgi:general secretion pathway protein G
MVTQRARGFTLLEVLVSATIIAVLTAIGIVSYASVNKRSRDVKRKSDMEQMRSALEMFRADNNEYPNPGTNASIIAGQFNQASVLEDDLVSTYLPAVSTDPDVDQSYYYQPIATGGVYTSYCLCSYLETLPQGTSSTTCTVALAGSCNYGLKSP